MSAWTLWLTPLRKLQQELLPDAAARLATQLDAIHLQLPSAASGLKPQAAEHPAERPPSDAFEDRAAGSTQVGVEGADFENLLKLQKQLSNLERVSRVSVTRLEHGRATEACISSSTIREARPGSTESWAPIAAATAIAARRVGARHAKRPSPG